MTTVTQKIRSTDWLATVFYPLAVILMESFWVAPWLGWIGNWTFWRVQRPVLSLAAVVIVLAVSVIATRIFTRPELPMKWIQSIIIGLGIVTMLLVLGVEYRDGYTFFSGAWFAHTGKVLGETFSSPSTIVTALLAIIYLWWRGIMLGQSTSYFKDIYRSFILGMSALILLIIIWRLSSSVAAIASPGSGLGLNVIAFFFFGLLAIAICHLYVMRSTMPKEDAKLTSVWRWMPVTLGVIGGMVLIGFLIASVFSPDMMASISHGLQVVAGFLGKLISYILTPIVYLFQGIAWLILWIIKHISSQSSSNSINFTNGQPNFGEVTTKGLPSWVTEVAKITGIIIIVGLILFIMARSIARYRARKALEEMDEVNESLFSWKGFRDDLKQWLNSLGQRFQRKAKPIDTFDPNAPGRLDIREIFRHIQWEGQQSGITRYRHETAAEYAYRLERAVPNSVETIGVVKESVSGIKDMYETVRYGETALPEPHVDQANGWWQTIKTMMRKLRGE